MNEQEVLKLYNALIGKGYSTDDLGDEQRFVSKMADANNRKQLYDWVSSNGDFRIGDYETYETRLAGANEPKPQSEDITQPEPTQEEPQPVQEVAPAEEKKPVAQANKPVTAADAGAKLGGLAATAKAVKQAQPQEEEPQEEEQAVDEEEQPQEQPQAQQEKPQGITPSTEEILAMRARMNNIVSQSKQVVKDTNKRMENIRKGNKMGDTAENVFNPETGKWERKYYTTTGEVVDSPEAQSQINMANRDVWEATTEEGRRHYARRILNDYEERLGSVLERYDDENTAELAWQEAEEKTRAAQIPNPTGNSTIAAATLFANQIEHMKYHDLKRMADRSWEMLGKEKQQAIVDDIYDAMRPLYSEASDKDVRKAAKKMARQMVNQRLFELAVAKNAPQDATEYFFRKAVASNAYMKVMEALARSSAGTTGDMEARDVAEQIYGKNHKVAGLAGTVTGFAIDPLVWISAGAGSAATRGALWAGGRYFGEAAARKFATTLGGRVLLGAVGGAGNFATFEAGGEALEQARYGGKVTLDPETSRYIIGDYDAGEVGKRALRGAALGTATGVIAPLIGNVSDKLVNATKSTAGKLTYRAGELGVSTVAEGTIFSVPEWIEGKEDAMDVWTDNLAMMAAFKLQHGIKSAPRVIGELSADPKGLKAGFETRLRSILDGRTDLALTADEKRELKDGGYGDLSDLVDEYSKYRESKSEYDKGQVQEGAKQIENKSGENALPYNRFVALMRDGSISEAARAKMYYYITGRMLPMSTVMGSSTIEKVDADGNVTGYEVQSVGANGVITSRTFDSKERAEVEADKINRQAELNSVDVGERYADANGRNKRMYEACQEVADEIGVPANKLFELVQKEPTDEVEREWKRMALAKFYEDPAKYTAEKIRNDINEEFGVDVDEAIKKEPNKRSDQEKEAVRTYLEKLFDGAKRIEYKEDASEESPLPTPFDNDDDTQSDPIADAFQRGYDADEQERREIAVALGAEQEPSAELQEAWKGVVQRINEDADYIAAKEREEAKQRQHTDGTYKPVQLKDGTQAFVVDGNLATTDDGQVDVKRSDNVVVVFDPATGQRKQVNPLSSIDAVYPETSQEWEDATIEANKKAYIQTRTAEAQGVLPFVAGDTYNVVDEGGNPHSILVHIQPADETPSGEILVSVDGGEPTYMNKSDIQAMADRASLAEVAQRAEDDTTPEPSEAEEPSNGLIEGAPSEYTEGTELVVRDEDGNESPAMVMGRVRLEDGKFVPDENGKMIEYLSNGEVKHDYVDDLNEKVVGYRTTEEETGSEQAVVEASPEQTGANEATAATTEEPVAETEPADTDAMPMNGEEPDFLATTPERGHRYLFEESGWDADEAGQFIEANKKAADKALATIQGKKPKMGTSVAKYNKDKADWQAKVDAAQAAADYWNAVSNVQKAVEEAEKQAAFAEQTAEPLDRQMILDEQKTPAAKIAAAKQMYGDYFDSDFTVPYDVSELVAMNMPNEKISWEGREGVRGLQQELGSNHIRRVGKGSTTGFNTYLAKKGEGISTEKAIHDIWESPMNQLPDGEKRWDTEEIRAAFIDMFRNAEKPTDIRDYVYNNRVRLAEQMRAAEDEAAANESIAPNTAGGISREGWNGHEVGDTYTWASDNGEPMRVEVVGFDRTNGDTPEVLVRVSDKDGNLVGSEAVPPLVFEEELKYQQGLKERADRMNDLQQRFENAETSEEKVAVVTEALNEISDGDKFEVITNGTLIETLRGVGANDQTIAYANEQLALGNKIKGFFGGGIVFVNSDAIGSIDDARSKFVHERQHKKNNEPKNFVYLQSVKDAATSEELADLLRVMSGTNAYDEETKDVLADEFIAHAMEVAYRVPTEEALEAELASYGASQDLIEIIKNINNEQRKDGHLSQARRNVLLDWGRNEGRNRQDERDSQTRPERGLEQQGAGTPEQGAGRTQEVVPEGEQTPKNTTIDDVIPFSISVNHNSPYLLKKADGSFVDPETGERLGFDHRFMGRGEGGQAHGWGSYFSVNDLRNYAKRNDYSFRSVRDIFDVEPVKDSNIRTGDKELDRKKAIFEAAYDLWDRYDIPYNYDYSPSDIRDIIDGDIRRIKRWDEHLLSQGDLSLEQRSRIKEDEYRIGLYEYLRDHVKDFRDRHHYAVDIPDDTGTNYIDERKPISNAQVEKIKNGLLKDEGYLQALGWEWRKRPKAAENVSFEEWAEDAAGVQAAYGLSSGKRLYDMLSDTMRGAKFASWLLNRLGITGIRYDGRQDGECYVIFDENDAKITDHIRFSVADKERTLMGVHNISEAKLKKAIKQGGLANPSMAVVDTKQGIHTEYGDISLIPKSELIDTRKGRNAGTYAGDAWTPTYPNVTRDLTEQGDKHREAIAKEAAGGDEDMEYHILRSMADYVEGNSDRMHYLFLKQKGLEPEIRYKKTTHTQEEYDAITAIFGEPMSNMPKREEMTKEQNDALVDLMMQLKEAELREGTEKYKDQEQIESFIKKRLENYRNRIADEDGWLWFAEGDNFIYGNWRDAKRRETPERDWYGTEIDASNRVAKEGMGEEYESWKESLFDEGDIEEKLFAGWTPSGYSKYVPNTIENASKLMNKEAAQNAYDRVGFSPTRAMLLQRFTTLDDIRRHKDLIQKSDEAKDRTEELSDELLDICNQISDMQKIDDNRFINIDIANRRLQEALLERDPIGHLNKVYGYSIDKEGELASQIMNFIEDVKNLPARYFETKFKRPVGLDEFAVAVVPEDTSAEVTDALKEAGLEVHTYTKDENDQHRTAAVMNAVSKRDDILFSIGGNKPNRDTSTLAVSDMTQDELERERQRLNDIVEKPKRIEKLRNSEPASITGNEIVLTGTEKEKKNAALKYGQQLQGTYTNADTGNVIQLQRGRKNGGLHEVLQHNYKDIPHLQSVAAIPQIIEKSIYISSMPNEDVQKNPNVVEYQHYVCGLKIGEEDYTVHALVGVDRNGNRYYDHNLVQIEKGKLLDHISGQAVITGFGTTPSTKLTTNSDRKVNNLISILQVNDAEISSSRQRLNEIAFRKAQDELEDRGISIDNRELLDNYGLSNLTLAKSGDHVTLSKIVAAEQGKGNGTRFMEDLARLADANGWTLALTPDTSFGGTSVSRLKDFYKKFGFKDNKGRNTDFETRESMVRKPQEIRFSFAGIKGATNADKAEGVETRMKALGTAKQMEEDGRSALDTKIATGWERGKDGKWRYEMPDLKLHLSQYYTGTTKLSEIADAPELFAAYPSMEDIEVEVFDNPLTGTMGATSVKRVKDSNQFGTAKANIDKFPTYESYLSTLEARREKYLKQINEKERPEEYEDVKDILDNAIASSKAEYDRWTSLVEHADDIDKITISLNNAATRSAKESVEKTLIHEVQHVIQEIEGFAKGGNVKSILNDEEVRNVFIKELQDRRGNAEAILEEAKQSGDEERIKVAQSIVDKWDSVAKDFMNGDVSAEKAFEMYQRIAGEVEARNAAERSGMTPEERRRSLAEDTEDYYRGEQIVTYGDTGESASIVAKDKADELEKEPKVKVYRAMQLRDGKLYPPMAGKINGEWQNPIELGAWEQADEHPELATNGKFKLDKGNGSTLNVAYNPYLHTSRSPLNDQFSSAWSRPELVTVEVEVPESELTSGYKAEGAKDAVGEVEWKSGVVSSQLAKQGNPRKVILSRYDKPIRIVPTEEVAERIAEMLKGTDIEIPFNTVTPELREALEAQGVKIGEPQKGNAGAAAREAYDAWKNGNDVRFSVGYDPRGNVPKVRGGWTEKKILKYLKENHASHGMAKAAKLISEFDSPEELKEHMFYHGTVYGDYDLKPSITMRERDVERYGGGGYGDRYWGISLTKDKTIASNFSGTSSYVRIFPVVLAKNAKVVERPDFSDAADLEDHIVELWEQGVDAVWIGEGGGGELELCVLNPKAICVIEHADGYQVYGLTNDKINIASDADIENIYNAAKDYEKNKGNRPRFSRKLPFPSDFGATHREPEKPNWWNFRNTEEYENAIKKYEEEKRKFDAYKEARSDYDKAKEEFENSPEMQEWKEYRERVDKTIRFSVSEDKPTFYSNAERAVEGIKQEKATPDQWLAMIQKAGGLKAGEDKWMGLSDWLKSQDKKSLTKQEVMDFIRSNRVEVEDVHYSEVSDVDYNPKMKELRLEFDELVQEGSSATNSIFISDWADWALNEMVDRYGDDFRDGFAWDKDSNGYPQLMPSTDWDGTLTGQARYYLDINDNPINGTRLEYTTSGLDNKHEIALVVPSIESWNESDDIHFGDAGEGRAIAWIRFGDAYTWNSDLVKKAEEAKQRSFAFEDEMAKKYGGEEWRDKLTPEEQAEMSRLNAEWFEATKEKNNSGNLEKVLVIDEIQSKRHQEGREKGYEHYLPISGVHAGEYVKVKDEKYADRISFAEVTDDSDIPIGQIEKIDGKYRPIASNGQRIGFKDFEAEQEALDAVAKDYTRVEGIPDAPFDKNWHELAMKRMLRYAAENGYDKIAWTKGEQQAERYNIGNVVDFINVAPYEAQSPNEVDGFDVDIQPKNGDTIRIFADKQGNISSGEYEGRTLSDVLGKPLANKILASEANGTIEGDGLRIGAEGMAGFYDQILPRFMDKYGKKWGVKTEEIELPELEVDGVTMWSVDVTPEMKESVMQGQPMFREGFGGITYEESLAISKAAGYTKKQHDAWWKRTRRTAEDMAEKMHISDIVTIVERADELEDFDSLTEEDKQSKGWFDPKTGKIVVILGNHAGAHDVLQTMLHEGVNHYGLRKMFGKHFDTFLKNVYNNASPEIRNEINKLMSRNGWNYETATEEYLGKLAEDTDFENAEKSGWWHQIKEWFLNMLRSVGLDRFFAPYNDSLSDNELRYILWRSYQNLVNPNRYRSLVDTAIDIAKQFELGVGKFAANTGSEERVAESGGKLHRDGDFTPRDKAIARDEYERIVSSGSYQFREAVQDSMLGLRRAMESIDNGTRIEDVPDSENAYTAENAMSSANSAQQSNFFREYMMPLLNAIHDIAGDSAEKREELIDYMMAKHGLERNEKFAARDAQAEADATNGDYDALYERNRKKDYSGLTALTGASTTFLAEKLARDVVDAYEAQHDTKDLWVAVNNATKTTLAKARLGGLLSQEGYEQIRDQFEYYIPLRGWDETTSDEVYGYLTSKDSPLMGGTIKHAFGRRSKADDPIATIAMMADDAIRQANRNDMKQRFLTFVENHPSDLVSVNKLWLQYDEAADEWKPVFADIESSDTPRDVERKVKAFEERMEQLAESEPEKYKHGKDAVNIPYKVVKGNLREHQVLVKRDGETYVLTINGNPRAAQALNGLTNPDVEAGGAVGNMLKLAENVNHQLSAFYTTRTPDFVISNFFRDMLYSNCMTWVKESPSYALTFHKNFGRVNPAMMGVLFKKWESGTLDESNELERQFKTFLLNGGETGYTNVRDIEAHKKAIAEELKRMSSTPRKAWRALGLTLDLMNRSVENCARFAAFLTSQEMGRSIGRSIYDAKEVSVNFNKKGAGGKMLNSKGQDRNILKLLINPKTYMSEKDRAELLAQTGSYIGGGGRLLFVFWNAGVQGMTNFGRAAKKNPKKFAAGAATLYALGAIMPLVAMAIGGDDDEYYDLPEYVRRSNICFRWSKDMPWITIPLPIEFRALYGLGELATGVITGKEHYSDGELAHNLISQVSQILPLDFMEGGGGGHAFIPSVAKPLVEAASNKSWTGLPIYKDTPYNQNDPEYTKVYKNADKYIVGASKWLNDATRRDGRRKGWADVVNPSQIEYMLNGYFGGFFKVPNQLVKMAETAFGDREFDWRNMMLANRLLKNGDETTQDRKLRNAYFKYKEEYEGVKHDLNEYQKEIEGGSMESAAKANDLKNSEAYQRYIIFDEYRGIADALNDAANEATDEERKASLLSAYYDVLDDMVKDIESLNPKAGEHVDSLSEMAFNDSYGTNLRKKIGSDIARRLGGKDSYGSPDTEYGKNYEKARDYVDIAADVTLQVKKREAKESGDTRVEKGLDKYQRKITELKHKLTGLHPDDDEVMESIRSLRQKALDWAEENKKE